MKTSAEIRLDNLREVIKQAGSLQAVADKLEKSHAQISQINTQAKHSTSGKPRTMGDEMARLIEDRFGLEIGWMDNVHPGESAKNDSYSTESTATVANAAEASRPYTVTPGAVVDLVKAPFWPFSVSPERFRMLMTDQHIMQINSYIDGIIAAREIERKSEAGGSR